MMIEPNDYVNVAKDGRFFCRIEFGSNARCDVWEKFKTLTERFPVVHGWSLEMYHVDCSATMMAAQLQEVR